MKRFVVGVVVGVIATALAVLARTPWPTGEKVIAPQVLTDNQKVTMVRYVLNPGESTPVHTHKLDHIAVVIQGSTLHIVGTDDKVTEQIEKTGDAVYVRGAGQSHSLKNAGTTTLELVSIELK